MRSSWRRSSVRAGDLIDQAVSLATPLILERRHELRTERAGEAVFLDGDEVRLTQVLANLLSNAARYTEPGGRMEAQLAEWVSENDSRLPIIAFMAGRFMDDDEMQGMSFGHAGTIVEGKEDSATEKIARLEAAGIPVVERIDEIPDAVKRKLEEKTNGAHPAEPGASARGAVA